MKSMTGFGRGESVSSDGSIKISAEISSVNRKQLDLRISVPREIAFLEPVVRGIVNDYLKRGTVSGRLTLECGDKLLEDSVAVNEAFVAAVLRRTEDLRKRFSLSESMQLKDVMALPGAIETKAPDFDEELLKDVLSEAVVNALENVVVMRQDEGQFIKQDLTERIKVLEAAVAEAEKFADEIPLLQREKLLKKLEDAGLPVDLDDERIVRELVIYADKADVSEEITRLRSHFEQFGNYLNEKTQPVGRSMDFLIQEMNREITTLGNKAGNSSISPLVVKMKTELEKIREQVQNVE